MSVGPDVLFERERPRLTGLAYRLLGSVSDAEDVVQDTWFRWASADHQAIERPEAWLTTVCSRVGLDRLRSRQRDRLDYVGPWLPEPVAADPSADPAATAELSDSLTTAFLVMLERLRPEERLAVLLADVFGEPFSAVAAVTGKTESACRQLAARARRKLREPHPLGPVDPPAAAWGAARALVSAVLGGDIDAVTTLLAPDAVMLSDGGAATHAARRPVVTAGRIARLMVNLARRSITADLQFEELTINGSPAVVVRGPDGSPRLAQAVDVVDGRIVRVHTITNPDKLAALDRSVPLI